MAGEFIIKNGSIISGSLEVTGGITGSFGGSVSTAETASYVNPLTQSVFISSSNETQLQVGDNLLFVSSSGNVGIGTTSPAYKLDVNGSARLNGLTSINRTSVANTALAIGANGTGAGNFIIQGYDISSNQRFYLTASGNFRINGAADNGASGHDEKFRLDQTFNPTSGTRTHYSMWLRQTINQTGGANGITRGLYVNPTLTSAADYRAIETTAGKVIFNGGNVGIGTTSPTAKLQIKGSGTTSATTSLLVENANASGSMVVFDDGTMNAGKYNVYPIKIIDTGSKAEITGSILTDSLIATTSINANAGMVSSGSVAISGGTLGVVSTGTSNATSGLKVQNSTPDVTLEVKDDGELNINTTKYSNNGVLTNNGGVVEEVAGWTGIININTIPPIAIDVQNGIIVNVT